MGINFVPEDTVEVPEISFEDEVRLPAGDTAVLVMDMQNDFVKEEGSLLIPAASETVGSIQQLLETARAHDVHIVYTQDTMVEGDPEFDVWPEHCVEGTWGWEIIEELAPQEGDLICKKNRYDGFYGTWLDHFLSRVWDVEHVVIVGTVANICVLHTAASAGLRYFHVVLPANSISALTDFDQAMALRQISWLYKGSVVRSVEDIRFES